MANYTLIQSGDADAAENVGALAGTIPVNHIVDGLALSGYDPAAPSIDVDAGKTAHVLETATAEWTEDDGTQQSEKRDHVQIVAHLDTQTIALDDGATNHLFVDPNVGASDSPPLVANTTGSAPSEASVKIGEVDTANDVSSGQWRLVAGDGTLTYPDSAAANADLPNLPNGTVVYDRSEQVHISDGIDAGTVSADSATTGTQTVTDELTDPGGMTYTGTINPVQVTEEAITFGEEDVTVISNNGAVASGGSIQLLSDETFPDDFEDGVDSGWTGDTNLLSATTSVVLTGSQSGEFTNTSDTFSAVDSPSMGDVTANLGVRVQVNNKNTPDNFSIDIYTSNDTRLCLLYFDANNGDITLFNGSNRTLISGYAVDSPYSFVFDWNFANDEVSVAVDGDDKGTFALENSVSDWDYVTVNNNKTSGDTIYFDNLPASDTGDALIEWDSGVPDDIKSWDLATFQRTLDNETVTVDVEDGSGNVLYSNIGQNSDISTVSTSKNVKLRANLSRSDTANNPTLDYAARRFTR